MQLARALQELNSFFTWHPLVGHDQRYFITMLLQKPVSILGVGGTQNAKLVPESSGKIFQRHFLIIDVKNGVFLVIVKIFHLHSSS